MNQVFALQVGEKATTRSQFLYRDPSSEPLVLAFYFWLVLGPDGPIAVDCSIGPQEAARRKIDHYQDRRTLLAGCGVAPADVKTVFVTHLHYDHWSGFELFPNATYFVQAREIAFWKGPGRSHPLFAASADLDSIAALDALMATGRIKVVDGEWSPCSGLKANVLGGHTPGLQTLTVDCGDSEVLVASDTFHFYENLEQRRPVQVTVNMLDAIESMEAVAALARRQPSVALPGHDPLVMRRFTLVAPGVVRVA